MIDGAVRPHTSIGMTGFDDREHPRTSAGRFSAKPFSSGADVSLAVPTVTAAYRPDEAGAAEIRDALNGLQPYSSDTYDVEVTDTHYRVTHPMTQTYAIQLEALHNGQAWVISHEEDGMPGGEELVEQYVVDASGPQDRVRALRWAMETAQWHEMHLEGQCTGDSDCLWCRDAAVERDFEQADALRKGEGR